MAAVNYPLLNLNAGHLPHQFNKKSLGLLDSVGQLVLEDIHQTTPPNDPELGQAWHIGTGAAGTEWAGQNQSIAVWFYGWMFFDVYLGLEAYIVSQGKVRLYRNDLLGSAAWTDVSGYHRLTFNIPNPTIIAPAANNGIPLFRKGSGDLRLLQVRVYLQGPPGSTVTMYLYSIANGAHSNTSLGFGPGTLLCQTQQFVAPGPPSGYQMAVVGTAFPATYWITAIPTDVTGSPTLLTIDMLMEGTL